MAYKIYVFDEDYTLDRAIHDYDAVIPAFGAGLVSLMIEKPKLDLLQDALTLVLDGDAVTGAYTESYGRGVATLEFTANAGDIVNFHVQGLNLTGGALRINQNYGESEPCERFEWPC